MTPLIAPSHPHSHRLLLVDDDAVLRETLTDVLTHEGFKVIQAASGEEAEQILGSVHPPLDLVLTDLVMPGRNGMDVLRKALKVNPACSVLVLSGFASVREATEAMEQGAYGMVTKPLHLDQFRNILMRLQERTDLIQECETLRDKALKLEERVEELEAINGRMEMLAQRIAPSPDTGADPLADLERLAGLRSRGMLTEEQFEVAKRVLFSKWLT